MTPAARIHILITLVGIVLYLPFLSHFHLFDWDEINFAEAAREMLVTQNYGQVQIAFENFWEKPPLYIWMQALSMKLFGINEFAARFPNAIFGILTLNVFYSIARKIKGHFFGLFWVLVYTCSMAPFIYFKLGIMDPVFNLFMLLAIYQYFLFEKEKLEFINPSIRMVLLGLFLGLAVITKGPVAMLIVGLVILSRWVLNARFAFPNFVQIVLFLISFIAVVSIWLAPELIKNGTAFIQLFLTYQAALFKGQMEWHNQPIYYHVVVLFFVCFPASVFAFWGLKNNRTKSKSAGLLQQYMLAIFWIVLIVFSIVTTKIVHYSSMCWIPISYFAANALYRFYIEKEIPNKKIIALGTVLQLLLGIVFIALFVVLNQFPQIQEQLPKINDKFAVAILNNAPFYNPWLVLIPVVYTILNLYLWLRIRKNAATFSQWIFLFSLFFVYTLYLLVAPQLEKKLQGNYISFLQQSKKPVDVVGFKSYAQLFYYNSQPKQFVGPWGNAEIKDNSILTRLEKRQWYHWHNTQDTNIHLVLRMDFKPHKQFTDSFQIVTQIPPYEVWKSKIKLPISDTISNIKKDTTLPLHPF